MYAQLIFALGYCFHLFGRRRADLRVCAAADVFGCAEGALRCGIRCFARGKRVKACNFIEKYRANRRACLTFHGNLCTIIKMEIFCPHEPCGRL